MSIAKADLIHAAQIDGTMVTSVSPKHGALKAEGGWLIVTTLRARYDIPVANLRAIQYELPPKK